MPFCESGLDLAPAARMRTLRCRISKAQNLRAHRHLQHTFAPVAEQIIGLDDVVEGEAVGDERERVEAA